MAVAPPIVNASLYHCLDVAVEVVERVTSAVGHVFEAVGLGDKIGVATEGRKVRVTPGVVFTQVTFVIVQVDELVPPAPTAMADEVVI